MSSAPEGSGSPEVDQAPELQCPLGGEEEAAVLGRLSAVVEGYLSVSLATAGILANLLAIWVFSRRTFKSNFNNLLISLAICDLLFLVICITESVRRTFQDHGGNSSSIGGMVTQVHHHLFPYFLYPLHNILLSTSIFMTVSISIERYLAIFHPLVYKMRREVAVLVGHILPAVLLAVAVNIPKFLETEVEVEGDTSYIAVTELRMSREYSLYYQHWTRFIFLGILPFVLLLGLNLKIFIQIFKVSSFKKDRRSSVLLLLLVAVFLLCHAPRLALNLYEALDFEGVARCGPPAWALVCSMFSNSLLPVINSSSNLLIFLAAEPRVRATLRSLLVCGRGEAEEHTESRHTQQLDTVDTGDQVEMVETGHTVERTKLLL